jgi:hypothetical protein
MFRGIRIHGSRPDGVLLCDLGDRQLILVNVVDHVKTTVLTDRAVDQFGPWALFGAVKPDDSVRKTMLAIVDQPGNVVPASAVGALDFNYRDVQNMNGPSRQEFADMLQTANLEVGSELPDTQNFQDDGQFFQHCISEIVPSLNAAGITIENPNSFCALMHLERTGIMPRATSAEAAAVAATPQPVAEASDIPSQVTVPAPGGIQPTVGMASLSDDGPSNVALAVTPGEAAATEMPDLPDLESGDEGDAEDEAEPIDEKAVSAKVKEIDECLDECGGFVDELMELLSIEAQEEFDNPDKSLSLAAKLSAIRNFGAPEPNDAGLPMNTPVAPVSAAPHGVAGGALGVAAAEAFPGAKPPFGSKDASEVAGKPDENPASDTEGKPEVTSQPSVIGPGPKPNPFAAKGSSIGKPNKKKPAVVEACGQPTKP